MPMQALYVSISMSLTVEHYLKLYISIEWLI